LTRASTSRDADPDWSLDRRDVTAARALKRLIAHVTAADAELCLARTRQPVRDQLKDARLVEAIGEDRLFPTVRSAVEAPHDANTHPP
jgi:hypothetical protein